MRKTVVVGLDGAGFELLTPWLEAGELPNVRRIVEGGVAGDLQSVPPPVTSPNWKAYTTGKNPGKFGVFWWRNVDMEAGRLYLPIERYHEHVEFFEIVAEREPVGVLNVPTTYPPKALGGDSFVVAGPPDGRDEGFAHPPALERELRHRFDYRVTKQRRLADEDEAAYEEVLELIDSRFRVARQLLDERDPAFLQVTTFYLNSLHHHLWDDEYTLEGWRTVDEHLGALLERDDDLVLMSDHGHEEIETVFHVNEWLHREGYLAFDTGVSDALHGLGVTAERVRRLLSAVDRRVPGDLQQRAAEHAPDWLVNNLPNEQGRVGVGKLEGAEWDRTAAIASAEGPIYLTADPGSDRYERLRDELARRLGQLTDPAGEPVVDAVYPGDLIYAGEYADEAPDLVLEAADGVRISESVGRGTVFGETARGDWNGVNSRRGLFAATGPSFATGTVEGLSILDLAPTLLHLRGYPVPDDMDGRVRRDVFAADSEPARRDVIERPVEDCLGTATAPSP
jgi:predicted AlkP superfamily phosphohydrolase/phosphomutase